MANERDCASCGSPCRFLLCDACHERATSEAFSDDAPAAPDRFATPIPEVGLPASCDGVRRF